MSIDSSDWEIYTIAIDETMWFCAFFVATDLPYIKRASKVAAWLKQTDVTKVRPTASSAALSCVPSNFASKVKEKLVVIDDGREILVFDTLEMAVRMEAAFWLDRQFLQGKRHWYQQQDISSFAARLKSECKAEQKLKEKESGKNESTKTKTHSAKHE